MIASIRGTLLEKGIAHCVIEAGGVGYLVQVSSHTAQSLPSAGEPAFLRLRQIVREDALLLFGFSDLGEQRLFDLLLTVSGVGPKVAIGVLSGLKPAPLARAIREEKIGLLTAVPGIGRKTAERIVVELRDKVEVPAASAAARESGVLPRSARFDDAVAALVHLGYTAAQAQETVREVSAEHDDPPLETLVRSALSRLGKAAAGVR
jgi:Holliday junction DNA helicase RuvA